MFVVKGVAIEHGITHATFLGCQNAGQVDIHPIPESGRRSPGISSIQKERGVVDGDLMGQIHLLVTIHPKYLVAVGCFIKGKNAVEGEQLFRIQKEVHWPGSLTNRIP